MFCTTDVLTVYRTYLPKIINVALNLSKLLLKKSTGLFLWTQCRYIYHYPFALTCKVLVSLKKSLTNHYTVVGTVLV